LDSSLILSIFVVRVALVLFLKLIATVRTDIVLGVEILAALGTGEGEFSATGGADLIVGIQGTAAVRTEVDAARWALVILFTDWLATIATEGGSLDPGAGTFFLVVRLGAFVYKALFEFSATMGTDRCLGRDLFITYGAIEAKLCPAVGTDRIVRIHLAPTLGTEGLFLLEIVDLLVVSQICGHDSPHF